MAEAATDIHTGGPVLPSVSVAVVARLLDVTERRVQQLSKQGILTKDDRGKYDLLKSGREYIRYLHTLNKEVETDPDKMSPKERLDWYKGTREKTRHMEEAGQLIQAADYERALSSALKSVAVTLESLPDVLERDAGIDGAAVEAAQGVIDRMRADLYQRITADA
jgi:phage terminase Nu1 subunit (DNA packaging protein)